VATDRTKPADLGREQYFDREPASPSDRQGVVLDLPDLRIALTADRGTFSFSRVDTGTEVLLRLAPTPEIPGDLVDLGCGYGPIAIALAHRYRNRQVWAVDINRRALELARENAERAGLTNVRVAEPEQVGAEKIAAIYSNPPVRIGKEAMRRLLLKWLARVADGGFAVWVVKKNLGADTLADFLTEAGYPTTRVRSRQGYRVLLSRRAA